MEPEKKTDGEQPEKNLDGLKGFNLDKTEELKGAARDTLKKGLGFFKKAKAALEGDEAAQNDLAKTFADAQEKVEGAVEQAKVSGAKIAKKVEDEINKRKPK